MIKPLKKRGQILAENVIFIVLNLVFISILLLFVYSKSDSEAVLEEKYAKQIALIIDSAKPGMVINLYMEDALSSADKNNLHRTGVVNVANNKVTVKLREKGGSSYYFFNNIDANATYNSQTYENGYTIFLGEYK